jgi:hypothetical protein
VLGHWVSHQREHYAPIEPGKSNKSHFTSHLEIGCRNKNKVSLSSKDSLSTDAVASSISLTHPTMTKEKTDVDWFRQYDELCRF